MKKLNDLVSGIVGLSIVFLWGWSFISFFGWALFGRDFNFRVLGCAVGIPLFLVFVGIIKSVAKKCSSNETKNNTAPNRKPSRFKDKLDKAMEQAEKGNRC